jgi:hypothetical protein
MPEKHRVAGPPRGEPLAAGRVGARVRIPLSGTPSPRWSRVLAARLSTALVGHPAVGHLGLEELVQGADIVLEGVEAAEAGRIAPALVGAIEAANRDSEHGEQSAREQERNMSQDEADSIAGLIHVDYPPPEPRRRSPAHLPGR